MTPKAETLTSVITAFLDFQVAMDELNWALLEAATPSLEFLCSMAKEEPEVPSPERDT